jgi:hypothetical protein
MGTASCGDPADVARVLNYELNKYPASQYKSGGTGRRISHPAGLSASVQPASPAREDAVGSEREEPEYPPVSHGRRPSGGCRLGVDRRGCYTEGDAAERSAAHHVVTRCDDHRPHDEMRGPELRHIFSAAYAHGTPPLSWKDTSQYCQLPYGLSFWAGVGSYPKPPYPGINMRYCRR